MSSQPPNTNSSVQPGPAPTIGSGSNSFNALMRSTAPVNGDDIQAQPVGPNTAVNGQATTNSGGSLAQSLFGSQSTSDNSSVQSFINKLAHSPGMDGQGATVNQDPQNGTGTFTIPPMPGPIDIGLNISTPCGMSVQERVATLSCYEYHYFDLVCNGQVFPYFFPGYWIGHDLGVIAGQDYVCQSGPGNIDGTKPVQVILLNNNSDIGNNGVSAANATANESTSLANTIAAYSAIGYDIPPDTEAVFVGPGGVSPFPRCATGCLGTGSSYTVPFSIQGTGNPVLGTSGFMDQNPNGPLIPITNPDGTITWQNERSPNGPDIMQGPANNTGNDQTIQVIDSNGRLMSGNAGPGSSLQGLTDRSTGETIMGLKGYSLDQVGDGSVDFKPLQGGATTTDQWGDTPFQGPVLDINPPLDPGLGPVVDINPGIPSAPLQGTVVYDQPPMQATVFDSPPLQGTVTYTAPPIAPPFQITITEQVPEQTPLAPSVVPIQYLPSPTPIVYPVDPQLVPIPIPTPVPISYPNPYNQPINPPKPPPPPPPTTVIINNPPASSLPGSGGGGGQQVNVNQLIIVQDDSSQTYITTG